MKSLEYIYKSSAKYAMAMLVAGATVFLSSCGQTEVSQQRNAQHGQDTETPGQATRPMEMNDEYYTDTNTYNPDQRQSRKRDPDQNTMIDGDQANDNTVTEE